MTEAAAQPTVPMTAVTQTCDHCGAHGESTVTLTVPVAVVVDLTRVFTATVPVETAKKIPTAVVGLAPVQAGGSRLSGLSPVVIAGIAFVGALLGQA